MDTTETENRQGSREKAPGDNVVQLPRDWLGPRDELVPFGPSAYRDSPAPVTELPRSADDFWGGADVPDMAVPSESTPIPTARRWSLPSLPRLSLRRPRLQAGVRPRIALLLGLGALGILAVIGFIMGTLGQEPSTSTRPATSSLRAATIAPSFDTRATELRDSAAQAASRARTRRARSAARARHQAEVRRRARELARRHRRHRTASTVQAVHYTTPTPAATADAAGSSSASSTGQTSPVSEGGAVGTSSAGASSSPAPSTASSATTSGAATTSGGASTGSGPSTGGGSSSSNQPALGASGTLGPGSSPDG